MNDDEAAVRDALVQLDAAFAHGDPQAIIDLCTEDVVFIGSGEGEEAVGPDGLTGMFAAMAERAGGATFDLTWETVDAEIVGDVAILTAWGEGSLVTPRRRARMRYRLSGVLIRQAGRWLWRLHHGSEPAAW